MARIDRKRLDDGAFPILAKIPMRFTDLDVQGHVNNAASAVILQEARVAFNKAAGLVSRLEGLRPVVAALSIEYADEMYPPEPIEVRTGVLAIGRTSVTIGQVARQGGRATLYAETVLVLIDTAGPAAISGSIREAYEGLLIRHA